MRPAVMVLRRIIGEASWLTAARIRSYSCILIVAYATAFAWLSSGSGAADPLGRAVGTDFASFYTASRALLGGEPRIVYIPERLAELQAEIVGPRPYLIAFFYPPVMFLLVGGLAHLPYLVALLVWAILSLGAYLLVLWRIRPGGMTLIAALAYPAVFTTLAHGQNALFATATLGGGLLLLRSHPVMAGSVLGLFVMKPHLALLVPVALVAGRHWRALAAAAASAAALVAATVLWLGPSIWAEFFRIVPLARETLERGLVAHYKFQSTFAAIRLAGGSAGAAYAGQVLMALLAAAAVARAWSSDARAPLQNAVLVCGGLIATPFVLDYDLALLAVAIGWFVCDANERGWLPFEKTVLVTLALTPLVTRPIGMTTGLLVAPAVLAAFLCVVAARIRQTPNHDTQVASVADGLCGSGSQAVGADGASRC